MNNDGTYENTIYINVDGKLCCDILYPKHWTKFTIPGLFESGFGLVFEQQTCLKTGKILRG